eukprot:468315-Alexandrium_andersonii.AAC.1
MARGHQVLLQGLESATVGTSPGAGAGAGAGALSPFVGPGSPCAELARLSPSASGCQQACRSQRARVPAAAS